MFRADVAMSKTQRSVWPASEKVKMLSSAARTAVRPLCYLSIQCNSEFAKYYLMLDVGYLFSARCKYLREAVMFKRCTISSLIAYRRFLIGFSVSGSKSKFRAMRTTAQIKLPGSVFLTRVYYQPTPDDIVTAHRFLIVSTLYR